MDTIKDAGFGLYTDIENRQRFRSLAARALIGQSYRIGRPGVMQSTVEERMKPA